MTNGLRIGLLVVAIALVTGAIHGAAIGDIRRALVFLGLVVLCILFERLVEVGSQK